MFHRNGKKNTSALTKPLKELTPVVSPAQLLSDSKRQNLLEKIRELSAIGSPRFDQAALSLINNFINHAQSLPETAHSYYALQGGLLDHALNRTEAALDIFRNYVIQEGTELSEEQKLWMYVLLSAGILQGVGKLQIDFKVELFDANGQFLKIWNPLLENMASTSSHYSFQWQKESEDNYRKRLNILLGRMMMPVSGFAWIVSNHQALAVWLALLNEDWQGAGTLGAILERANAISIQRYFNEFLARAAAAKNRLSRITTFVDTSLDTGLDKERQLGIEFIQWLMQNLEKGQIMINKAPLFMVPGGLLISTEMFKWFVREHPEYKNWQAVQNAFVALGVSRVSAGGNIISKFEQTHTQQILSGIVFSDYAIALPETVSVHHIHTGKVTAVSALDLMHHASSHSQFIRQQTAVHQEPLLHLSANGQWQTSEGVVHTIQPGSPHRV